MEQLEQQLQQLVGRMEATARIQEARATAPSPLIPNWEASAGEAPPKKLGPAQTWELKIADSLQSKPSVSPGHFQRD